MGCNWYLLSILGFSVFQPKLSLLQLQPLPRGFFFWENKAGMSHPLLMRDADILCALPHCFHRTFVMARGSRGDHTQSRVL